MTQDGFYRIDEETAVAQDAGGKIGDLHLVLPVDYTKGLEFDAVLLLNPTREDYPVEVAKSEISTVLR